MVAQSDEVRSKATNEELMNAFISLIGQDKRWLEEYFLGNLVSSTEESVEAYFNTISFPAFIKGFENRLSKLEESNQELKNLLLELISGLGIKRQESATVKHLPKKTLK